MTIGAVQRSAVAAAEWSGGSRVWNSRHPATAMPTKMSSKESIEGNVPSPNTEVSAAAGKARSGGVDPSAVA